MTDVIHPQIDSPWIIAMICFGTVGFIAHIFFVSTTFRHYFAGDLVSKKGRVFVFGCLLLLCFNMLACFIWALGRTNLVIPLSIPACKVIYASNFLCYFMGKYILHCLLIFRIYMTFRGSTLSMSRSQMLIFITIVSINFFIAMAVWTYSIAPSVLQGQWKVGNSTFEICTLFSEAAAQNLSVKISAITVGIEDFVVGTITFFVFLKRFRQVAIEAQDLELLESSTRFGVAALFSVISTLFLFTLAIPFYPNFTFILAIDATINSLCLFCVLSVGGRLYYYVCGPCRILGNRWLDVKRLHPGSSATELAGYFVNSSRQDLQKQIDSARGVNRVVITSARGQVAAVIHGEEKPEDPLTRPTTPRPSLDPVASLILVGMRGTETPSSVRRRLYELDVDNNVAGEIQDIRPQLENQRASKSEPVVIHDQRKLQSRMMEYVQPESITYAQQHSQRPPRKMKSSTLI